MESRKHQERELHNLQRTVNDDVHVADTRWSLALEPTIQNNPLWANMKYYAIERKSREVVLEWFKTYCPGSQVLDYCCGNGDDSFFIAAHGAVKVVGIDISEVSVQNCNNKAAQEGLGNLSFQVMDAENLSFADDTFDVVSEYGALHHLDLTKAYGEIARVLRPSGRALCVEALGHNHIIHLYRKLTPHLRTPWEVEHILRRKDVDLAREYFHQVNILGFFHLATLAAVPFRKTPIFEKILGTLEAVDAMLLRLPFLQWQAWHIIFELAKPKKQMKR
ncbi:MAG: class I SAM-dependent methyltransferase [Deltaproteobacteria bacterium]|nr:class I SAM-dependent methyltransferase [Deltaproteobacteria bacterium]